MSVRFNGTDTSSYASGAINPASKFTLVLFSKIEVSTANFACIIDWLDSVGGFGWEYTTDGTGLIMDLYLNGGLIGGVGHNVDLNRWHFYALTMASSASAGWWTGRAGGNQEFRSGIVAPGAFAGGQVYVGREHDPAESHNGCTAGVRIWNHVLLGHELMREMHSIMPAKQAGLLASWPLDIAQTTIRDGSNRHHDLTSNGGTIKTEGGPPVPRFPRRRGLLESVMRYGGLVTARDNAVFFGTDF